MNFDPSEESYQSALYQVWISILHYFKAAPNTK